MQYQYIVDLLFSHTRREPHSVPAGPNFWRTFIGHSFVDLELDLQNIFQQSYDYLTIMPKLRSTYDGRLIYEKRLTKNARVFLGTIHVQNRKAV